MKAPSPKDTKRKICGKRFTARGVAEHCRHHCPKTPNRESRVFKRSQCRHCGKWVHGNGLRVHVASMHPEQYARSRSVKAHRSPPPKAERRRSKAPADARPKHSADAREGSRKDSRSQHTARSERPRESKEETAERIWQQVQDHMKARDRKLDAQEI